MIIATMVRILKKELDLIYKKVDIVKFFNHYNVKISNTFGNELRMCCILPSHKDSNPSASFNIKKGLYNCYVCGGKTFFSLVQELENLQSFSAAVEFVKKMVGYEDEGTKFDILLDELNDIQNENVIDDKPIFVKINFNDYPEFENAEHHFSLVRRRVSRSMIDLWNLKFAVSGYYKDRLIVPLAKNDEIMSFAARDMSGRANKWLKLLKQAKKDKLTATELAELRDKYECKKIIYPPVLEKGTEPLNIIYGTPIQYLLFNIDNAVKRHDYVVLVEGVFDAMILHIWGYNTVALLGTKLSSFNRDILLSNFDRVYVCLDNDVKENKSNPGQESAKKIIEHLKDNIECYNIILPPNKDPDECSKDEFKQCFNVAEKIF